KRRAPIDRQAHPLDCIRPVLALRELARRHVAIAEAARQVIAHELKVGGEFGRRRFFLRESHDTRGESGGEKAEKHGAARIKRPARADAIPEPRLPRGYNRASSAVSESSSAALVD